ncbi:MAG: hypothetical protein ACI4T5_10470 [Prevotella sp.]
MAISKPMLPPKAGYVEVEVDGKRTYRNVTTGTLIDDEIPDTSPTEEEDTAAMLVDHEYRLTLLELGLTE